MHTNTITKICIQLESFIKWMPVFVIVFVCIFGYYYFAAAAAILVTTISNGTYLGLHPPPPLPPLRTSGKEQLAYHLGP